MIRQWYSRICESLRLKFLSNHKIIEKYIKNIDDINRINIAKLLLELQSQVTEDEFIEAINRCRCNFIDLLHNIMSKEYLYVDMTNREKQFMDKRSKIDKAINSIKELYNIQLADILKDMRNIMDDEEFHDFASICRSINNETINKIKNHV